MESRRSLRLEWMGWATSTVKLWCARCMYSTAAASSQGQRRGSAALRPRWSGAWRMTWTI